MLVHRCLTIKVPGAVNDGANADGCEREHQGVLVLFHLCRLLGLLRLLGRSSGGRVNYNRSVIPDGGGAENKACASRPLST